MKFTLSPRIILMVVATLIIAISIFVVYAQNNTSSQQSRQTNSIQINNANTDQGSYQNYAPDTVQSLKDDQRIVLFFFASWCPDCVATDKDINNNQESIPQGLTILRVNYDEAQELRRSYGVTTQHTFVRVDTNGVEIAQKTGLRSLEDIKSFAFENETYESFEMTVQSESAVIENSSQESSSTETKTQNTSRYITYQEDVIRAANPNTRIVLFFNASWCPDCKKTQENIVQNQNIITSDILIVSVDYDSNQSLRQKYGVTTQHSYVAINNQFDALSKTSGLFDIEQIIDFAYNRT